MSDKCSSSSNKLRGTTEGIDNIKMNTKLLLALSLSLLVLAQAAKLEYSDSSSTGLEANQQRSSSAGEDYLNEANSQAIPEGYDYFPPRTRPFAAGGDSVAVTTSRSTSKSSSNSANSISSSSSNSRSSSNSNSRSSSNDRRVTLQASNLLRTVATAAPLLALPLPLPLVRQREPEFYPPASYDFSYSVHDERTGDIKDHSESRDGYVVRGSYSLVDPDGYKRTVTYTADDVHGFNAVVKRVPYALKTLSEVPLSVSNVSLLKGVTVAVDATQSSLLQDFPPTAATGTAVANINDNGIDGANAATSSLAVDSYTPRARDAAGGPYA